MKNMERRTVTSELRASFEGKQLKVEGHAATFDDPQDIGYGFIEEVKRGAFAKTIQEADVRALLNHDANYVLGRNKAGTLRLSEDGKGLAYEIDLPDTTVARDLYTSIERGDISQSSYAFVPIKEQWSRDANANMDKRELYEVRLYDVSPVTYPAFENTDVAARDALRSYGWDSDAVARLVLKARAGVELNAEERAIVRAARDVLTTLATDEPGQRSHSAGSMASSAGALARRRARLALATRA